MLRMIDANFNRAREGLRVLEDLARFEAQDAGLAREGKELRHALTAAVEGLGFSGLERVASRDTPGDVGTTISTEAEKSRASLDAVAAAAAARVSEALRVIEELAKTREQGGTFEGLRYRVYTLERELRLRLFRKGRQWALCVLLTESLCDHWSWRDVVTQALLGGADCVQLREKEMTDRALVARARELVELIAGRADVIINDRVDVALAAGATGVHVGQTDLPVRIVREVSRGRLIVGISASTLSEVDQEADYVGLGPMFATTTKHKPTIAGPNLIREFVAAPGVCNLPHVAIGGISPENVGELVSSGCCGVAVSSAVCGAQEPAEVSQALVAALESNRKARTGQERSA